METKICSPTKGCGQEKSVTEFSREGKRYKHICRECVSQYDKKYIKTYPQTVTITAMLNVSKRRHKEKGFKEDDYNLTREFLVNILPEYCSVLGIKLECNRGKGIGNRIPNSPSLDRIDNSKGYTQDNVRIISWRANGLKSDSTPEERKLLYEDDLRLEKKNYV